MKLHREREFYSRVCGCLYQAACTHPSWLKRRGSRKRSS